MSASLDDSGFQRALKDLMGGGLDALARPLVGGAGQILLKNTRKAVSLRDHSMQDLAEMDHPYARRHGKIGVHGGAALVHTRSGRMLAALKAEQPSARTFRYGFDTSVAPHAVYVLQGTRVMLARDVFRVIYTDKAVNKTARATMESIVIKFLRRRYGR